MKNVIAIYLLTLLIGASYTVQANVIVDTGPGPSDPGGLVLDQNQWLAAEFTIDKTYVITDVEGWMGSWLPGNVTVAIYTGSNTVPTNEIFSSAFSVDGREHNWHGISGLSLKLDAGTYWSAFEVRQGQTLRGWMADGVPFPVGDYAVNQYENGWVVVAPNTIGLRISANPVSEPASLALLSLGLAGMGVTRWRNASSRTDLKS